MASPGWKNKLFFGDNLTVLRDEIADECVDLVYLDPPFNSNATYNVLFAEKSGEKSTAQIQVFDDTWEWGIEAESTFRDTVEAGGKLVDLLQAMRSFLGTNDMMAYIVMMAPRLMELRRALKPTGSIYLHCDPTASHYLKLLMDSIFGPQNFKNEVIWKRTSAHSAANRWGDVHDSLLFYTKSDEYTWSEVLLPHTAEYTARYRNEDHDGGRKWADDNLTAPGVRHGNSGATWRGFNITARILHWKVNLKTVEQIIGKERTRELSTTQKLDVLDEHGFIHWPQTRSGDGPGFPRFKRYLSEGARVQDVITDIPPINSQAQERLGYPTQKPETLLERIIQASSKEGDVILDSFCGCGTAISAAERLERRWIGIDVTHLATTLIKHRLRFAFGRQLAPYEEKGSPTDLEGARALARINRYQFEWWALGLVDARPAHDKKKGADKGVDGHIYFYSDLTGEVRKAVVQVKSGHVTRSMVGYLNSARERENAELAVFITLEPSTKPMREEAASAGIFRPPEQPNHKIPRMQIRTIEELLSGNKPELPRLAQMDTFKKPPRLQKGKPPEQFGLFGKRA